MALYFGYTRDYLASIKKIKFIDHEIHYQAIFDVLTPSFGVIYFDSAGDFKAIVQYFKGKAFHRAFPKSWFDGFNVKAYRSYLNVTSD